MGITHIFFLTYLLCLTLQSLSAAHEAFNDHISLGFDHATEDYKNYNVSRKLNKRKAAGFSAGVTGGRGGRPYRVTRSGDSPNKPEPGTLRYAVNIASSHAKGVWITFTRDMTIRLQQTLLLRSHTTIDGRGVRAIITGGTIGVVRIQNVILHNFQVNGVNNFDTVHLHNSTKVWVDLLTSFDGKLGLVSVVKGSTDVMISSSFLANNHFNMLIGASDADIIDRKLRVTVYRNWFRNSDQRMPHCGFGYCHVLNNLYLNWRKYAIGARAHAKVYSERNVFIAGSTLEVTPWFRGFESQGDTTPTIESKADLFLNGATFHQFCHLGK
ncbi:hypothetical protein SUGI_0107350 [Cryptomeria japonica]|nr:hypothetical protein SUGI_0107350 [Cryptomeria japonica]